MDSMSYVALYRTWRPQDFDGLVGQEHIRKALTNALESGRISHAYLFTGPRGTGKTSTARILAKALNCEKGPTPHPCNTCDHCREITEGTSADVIEIDAATQADLDIVFSPMSDETMSWLDELFSTCKRFGVDYYNASEKDRVFVEAVARKNYGLKQASATGKAASTVEPFFGIHRAV